MGVCPCEHMQPTLDGYVLMEHGKFSGLLDRTARLSIKASLSLLRI